MIDGYGRTIDYVRISVTDRCNLRCVYCLPEEGVGSISHEEILRFGEIERVCQILAENGIQKIKLTGGEPLVRRRLPELAAALKQIPGIKSLTITTNGVLLEEMYDALADAGVRPFFLAGGLGSGNLAQAIRAVNPWAVDLSSALETDGYKDPKKMREAVQIVRRTES